MYRVLCAHEGLQDYCYHEFIFTQENYHILDRSLLWHSPYKMERMDLETEESQQSQQVVFYNFYFHSLRTDLTPYVVRDLMVSQLMETFQATQPAVRGLLKTGQDFWVLLI